MSSTSSEAKKQIASILEKILEDICVEVLGELPSSELFPGEPNSKIVHSVSSLTGENRNAVKKKWDRYLKDVICTKRRMVRLEESEKHDLYEGKTYPDRLDIPDFVTVEDPFVSVRYAVLDIPKEIAFKIIALGFAPCA